jgi:3'-phosphoadenosine 5'-phosphosulfate sulfotransferase (PAPS reductase)/FAD synthetase
VTSALVALRVRRPLIDRGVEVDATISDLLAADAPVAIGVSGGKDSCAAAIATVEHLRAIGHRGEVVLVHADLGRVEWDDSLPTCERLASFLGVELLVVRRAAGDMMDRWLQRWRDNVRRYAQLSCVTIILPWSTPGMRFCTSELKSQPMAAALVRRFPGKRIISACGVRRDESKDRSTAPTSEENDLLDKKKLGTTGVDWNPIAAWTADDVFAYCAARGFEMHEGYTRFGMSRISCAFCIMANGADLAASAANPAHAALYREMVDLEVASAFAFQGSRWLGDVAPHLLTDGQRDGLARAKERAKRVKAAQKRIPKHLLYTRGWPTVMPSREEAELLAEVRREVADALGLSIERADAQAILDRYADLMAKKAAKEAAAAKKVPRKKKTKPLPATPPSLPTLRAIVHDLAPQKDA